MTALKHILARYTAFVWALLQPLGVWGVFGFAFVDAALLGMPLDPIVASYIYTDRRRFWLYILMASAGSALGSSILYLIGRKGGELLLARRLSPKRMERMRRTFEDQEFWALMLPSMLPPPVPLKLFVLSAAVFQMRYRHFLLAIFAGRVIRFSILAVLTVKFGPQIVNVLGTMFTQHLGISLALAGVVAAALVLLLFRQRRKRAAETA